MELVDGGPAPRTSSQLTHVGTLFSLPSNPSIHPSTERQIKRVERDQRRRHLCSSPFCSWFTHPSFLGWMWEQQAVWAGAARVRVPRGFDRPGPGWVVQGLLGTYSSVVVVVVVEVVVPWSGARNHSDWDAVSERNRNAATSLVGS